MATGMIIIANTRTPTARARLTTLATIASSSSLTPMPETKLRSTFKAWMG